MSFIRYCATLVLALLWLGCAEEDRRFAAPANTFKTYRSALASGDSETAWLCLSDTYQRLEYNDDVESWKVFLQGDGVSQAAEISRLEIGTETEINDRLAFLQFEPSTVSPGRTPFYYFLQEADGWKITSHLDSMFRVELETAIEKGEFQLPILQR